MDKNFSNNVFGDDLFEKSAKCCPITQDELEGAHSFDTLVESTSIKLKAPMKEDRQGDARTTRGNNITGDGPVVFSSEEFSMHRLLWTDGVMVDKTTATTKATFAVFRVNLESHTRSSGAGKNKAIQSARIQVEFHGTGNDAHTVGAKRPIVAGWAPFATAEKSNKTTAKQTHSRSMGAGLQAGAMLAQGTFDGTVSNSRESSKSYFDVNRSRPVSVEGTTGESSNYNGVRWELEHNHQAGEGVKPELMLYLLVTREDDREYAVRITANVDAARPFWHNAKEHKCVLRVTPKNPDATMPAVCYLQGKKMWKKLNRGGLEALLSPAMDSSLKLPWDLEEMAGSEDAESEAVAATTGNTKASTENEEDGKNEAAKDGGEDGGENNQDGTEGAATTEPSASRVLAASLAEHSAAGEAERPTKPLDDPAAMLDALLGLSGNNSQFKEEEDLTTRVEMLECRMELMEGRMARQALLIRALLRHRGQ
ncbi:hypothetical protein CGCF413_v015643 [Colletotrichum fructicola]|nr:hypothetical protein CGCF413_v015643 [Colletotrichum fructicola]